MCDLGGMRAAPWALSLAQPNKVLVRLAGTDLQTAARFPRLISSWKSRSACLRAAPRTSGVDSKPNSRANEAPGLGTDAEQLEQQLERLRNRVVELLEEGDDRGARVIVDANYELLKDQLNTGFRGTEQAALLDVLAQCHMDMADLPGAERLLKELEGIMVLHRNPKPFVGKIYEHMGSMYEALGQPDVALKWYSICLEIHEKLHGSDSSVLATALLGCADSCKLLGDTGQSIKFYHRLLSIVEKSKGSEDEGLVIPLSGIASALLEEGNALEAELSLNRALKIVKGGVGKDRDANVARIMSMLARAKHFGDDLEGSAALYHEALKLMERHCQEDGYVLERVRAEYATVLTVMERHKEAQELLEANLRSKQMAVGPNDLGLIVHLKNLATSYAATGKLDKCEPLIRRCLQLATNKFGPNAPQLAEPLEMLAKVLHHMGRFAEAEALARQFLQICEARFGKKHLFTGDACNCLAAILHSVKAYQESESLLTRVLEIQEASLPVDDPARSLTARRLAVVRHQLRRREDSV